jgi:hypothetical protein
LITATVPFFLNLDRNPILLGILRNAPDRLQFSDDAVEILPIRGRG